MSSALDMSLDEIIKSNKKSRSGGAGAARGRERGRGGSSGLGPSRGIQKRGGNRPTPYPVAAKEVGWQHMAVDQTVAARAGRVSSLESGTKLYVSNLDYGTVLRGDLKKYSIHYDRSGRSKGTAEVVYSRWPDSVAAVKRGLGRGGPFGRIHGGGVLGRGRGRKVIGRGRGEKVSAEDLDADLAKYHLESMQIS